MENIIMLTMIAGTIGLLAWWGTVMLSAVTGQKRKLAKRLSNKDLDDDAPDLGNLSVVLKEEGSDIPAFLAKKVYILVIKRKLAQVFPSVSLQKFLIIAACSGVLPAGLVALLTGNISASLGTFAVGGYLPILILNHLSTKRLQTMIRQLPDALDFLSRVMKAGHSLSTGLQMMAEELPKPLSTEFRLVYDQHSLGQPLEQALKEMSARIDSTDLSFFVTAVLIQRQTGGDLSEVLGNISSLIRSRMRLSQSVGAKTAEGRLTGGILVCFPVVMFGICYYLNPELYGGFAKNETGKMLLGVAGVMVILGIWCIRKITTVRV